MTMLGNPLRGTGQDSPARIILNNVAHQRVTLKSMLEPYNEIKLDTYMSWAALDHGYYDIVNTDNPAGKVSVMEVFINPNNIEAELRHFLEKWREATGLRVH